jgi:hypothetical protein
MDKIADLMSSATVAAIPIAAPLQNVYYAAVRAQERQELDLSNLCVLLGKNRDEIIAVFMSFPGNWIQFCNVMMEIGSEWQKYG